MDSLNDNNDNHYQSKNQYFYLQGDLQHSIIYTKGVMARTIRKITKPLCHYLWYGSPRCLLRQVFNCLLAIDHTNLPLSE